MYRCEFTCALPAKLRRLQIIEADKIRKLQALKTQSPNLQRTALEMFRGRPLTTPARDTRIGMYRYELARALRPKSTDSRIAKTAEILVFRTL